MATQPSSSHTPGPWVASKSRGLNSYEVHSTIHGLPYLADVWGADDPVPNGVGRDEARANARLIAASPDLLAACRAVAGVYEGQEDAPMFALKCRAALAKAEGR